MELCVKGEEMTDHQIRCLILKLAYDDPKGIAYVSRMSIDYSIDRERVPSNVKYLESRHLVKTGRIKAGGAPRMVDVGKVEITEQGIREYISRCKQQQI